MPDIAMNRWRTETFFRLAALFGLGVGEGALGHRDVVADVRQADRRAVVLRVDRGPAVELQAAGGRAIAQEGEGQLAILTAALGAGDDHPAVHAWQDLGLAVEVR